MDFSDVDVYSSVTLVDRAVGDITRPREFIFDGHRFVFPAGAREHIVPKFVAKWLFRVDQQKVWTKDGEFVCRFAVKAPVPKDLIDACGPDVADCDPIEIRTDLAEGSAVAELDPAKVTVNKVTIPREMLRERQGSGGRAGSVAR